MHGNMHLAPLVHTKSPTSPTLTACQVQMVTCHARWQPPQVTPHSQLPDMSRLACKGRMCRPQQSRVCMAVQQAGAQGRRKMRKVRPPAPRMLACSRSRERSPKVRGVCAMWRPSMHPGACPWFGWNTELHHSAHLRQSCAVHSTLH